MPISWTRHGKKYKLTFPCCNLRQNSSWFAFYVACDLRRGWNWIWLFYEKTGELIYYSKRRHTTRNVCRKFSLHEMEQKNSLLVVYCYVTLLNVWQLFVLNNTKWKTNFLPASQVKEKNGWNIIRPVKIGSLKTEILIVTLNCLHL